MHIKLLPACLLTSVISLGIGASLPGNNDADARNGYRDHRTAPQRGWKARALQAEDRARMLENAYQELDATMGEIEHFTRRQRGRSMRRIEQLIDFGRQRATNHFRVDASGGVDFGVEIAPAPLAPQVQIMSDYDLHELVQGIDECIGAEAKIDLVRDAARHYNFSVAQVIQLMNAAEFDSAKIAIAHQLFAVTVDPQRWNKVYMALDFQSSRKKLRRLLGH